MRNPKIIAASKYPTIPVDFEPSFLTHAEEPQIPEGDFVLGINKEHPASDARGRALVALLIGNHHPPFPVA